MANFMEKNISKTLLLLLMMACFGVSAQVDTAFWFAVPRLAHGHAGRPIKLCVATLDEAATVTVSKPAASSTPLTTFTVPANSSYAYELVGSSETALQGFECDPYNTPLNYGIYIHSTAKMNAYIAVQNNNSEIYALKGNSALGTQFFIPMQYQYENASYGGEARNSVQIIATENNTSVTIIPSQTLYQNGGSANSPVNVTLNRGQVYNFASNTQTATGHLGGTVVTSSKPIVVDVSDDSATPNGSNQDLVADQIVPEDLAGYQYVVVPSPSDANNSTTSGGLSDYAFIYALEDNTNVTVYYETTGGNFSQTQYSNLMRGDKRAFHFTYNKPAFVYSYHQEESADGSISYSPSNVFVFQVTGAGNELGGTQLPHVYCTGSTKVTYRPLAHPSNHEKHLFLTLVCNELTPTGQNILNGFQIQTNTGAVSIGASEWHSVPGSPAMRYCQKDISSKATSQYIQVSNSVGKFHMGMIDYHMQGSGYDDCSISYFSSYTPGSEIHWATDITHSDYCQGDTIFFGFDTIDASVMRIVGPNDLEINTLPYLLENAMPENSGLYTVVANDSRGCLMESLYDTIEITIHPSQREVVYDTICPGSDYSGYGMYVSGDRTEIPGVVYDSIVYQSTGFGCDSLLVLELTVRDSVFGEFDYKACKQYTWNGHTYVESGNYYQTLTDMHGCDSLVTMHLEIVEPEVEIVTSGDDFCEFGELVLTAVSDFEQYEWNTGETSPNISVTEPGLYTVTVSDGDCQASDHFTIPSCEFQLFIPNTITPSKSDDLNDCLSIPGYVHRFISEFDIEIFNRWGELVYKTNDINFRWCGEEVNLSNVYMYIIRVSNLDGKPFVYKGTVTVL